MTGFELGRRPSDAYHRGYCTGGVRCREHAQSASRQACNHAKRFGPMLRYGFDRDDFATLDAPAIMPAGSICGPLRGRGYEGDIQPTMVAR
jgi:hypothetical protein